MTTASGAIAPDDPRWVEVDPLLFSGQRIQTIAALRHTFGIELREAIVAAGERLELLSQTRRADFTVPGRRVVTDAPVLVVEHARLAL